MSRASYTKKERAERWKICEKYLRRHGSMPAAIKAAGKAGITYPTAVWISAFGKMLERISR